MSVGPPGNGEGRAAGNQTASDGPVNRQTQNEKRNDWTITASRNVSKRSEECPELTEESLRQLEQGIWELSLEIVKLRSRINPWLALTNNGQARRGGAPWE